MRKEIAYGIVKIVQGYYKGSIGYYDDDDVNEDGEHIAIVDLGPPLLSDQYLVVPYEYLDDEITTQDMYLRQKRIMREFAECKFKKSYKKSSRLLSEYLLIESLFSDRYIKARFNSSNNGKKIFLSHSSLDKKFVKFLATDLVKAGHKPWLDEWEIKVGQSIPKEISIALDECNFVVIILSTNSLASTWVENEWQSKYWDEVSSGNIKVIPVLLENCEVPRLLRHKKYADFRNDYNKGLVDILNALA